MFLDPTILFALAGLALLTGFVKSGLPVLGGLISVFMVMLFPPKDALGLAVLYLLVGDVIAVWMHWRKADWPILKQLIPAIFMGMLVGVLALLNVSNEHLGGMIGVIVLLMVAMEPLRPRITRWALDHARPVRVGSGMLAGFTTTVGNAAGPILSLYFLLINVDKYRFIGTASIFFLLVNVTKLPFYGAIGLFKDYYLWSYVVTMPFVLLGAFAGKYFLTWIPQQAFNRLILIITALSGAWLFVRYTFFG